MADQNSVPLVLGTMFSYLPQPGTYWPVDQRVTWLQAMERCFAVIYGQRESLVIKEVRADPSPPDPAHG